MAGLVKAKKYDFKDSNVELIGSDEDRAVKKAAAETERAWKGAGQKVGIQIWRIVKFKVTHWKREEYGRFFSGDSYIILNTYKEPGSDALLYDVHFWIGTYSTQDEYGTAAYKTVELDTLLDDKPIQHREVMNHESELFKSYFKKIELLEGGADTGFRSVEPEKYTPRLLHFHGDKKGVTVKEVPFAKTSLDSGDVYILDLGTEVYQWNGKTCNKDEKFKAVQYIQELKSERSGKVRIVETLDERDISPSHKFYSSLPETADQEEPEPEDTDFVKSLFRLSDATGTPVFEKLAEGTIKRNMLDPSDAFVIDTGKEVFVWVGTDTSSFEQTNAMAFAHNYLKDTKHPWVPVTALTQGRENRRFNAVFD